MPHQRTVIRQAVRDILIDGATAAGSRVYATRHMPIRRLAQLGLPALNVITPEEDSDDQETAPRELTRDLDLVVEAWVTGDDDIDDVLDALALEVENLMHADPYLAGAAADSVLVGTSTQVGIEGERPLGLAELMYRVTYRTMAPEATADDDMDDFLLAGTDYAAGQDPPEDIVEVQE